MEDDEAQEQPVAAPVAHAPPAAVPVAAPVPAAAPSPQAEATARPAARAATPPPPPPPAHAVEEEDEEEEAAPAAAPAPRAVPAAPPAAAPTPALAPAPSPPPPAAAAPAPPAPTPPPPPPPGGRRVAVITGGTGGIGCALARELLQRNAWDVILAVNEAHPERAKEVVASLQGAIPGAGTPAAPRLVALPLDLAKPTSVEDFASKVMEMCPRCARTRACVAWPCARALHATHALVHHHIVTLRLKTCPRFAPRRARISIHWLFLNAAVGDVASGLFGHTPQLTAEGHEQTVAVNYLGHYALTLRLMPALSAAAPARVISVSCGRHSHAWRLDFEDWQMLAPGTWFKVRA
jgi:NAD(P)-dependent dehydrogenase (short-subunit alcohol dehydrogenase family)